MTQITPSETASFGVTEGLIISNSRDIASAVDNSTGRLVVRQAGIAQSRPQSPVGVKYDSSVLVWEPPSQENVYSHFRIRIDNEGNDPIQVPSSQMRIDVTHGSKFFVSTYNEATDQESVPAVGNATGTYAGRASIAYYTAITNPNPIANTDYTPADGDTFTVFFLQDATGNRVPIWGSQFKNAPTTTPSPIDGTANTLTTFDFRGRGGSWYCISVRSGQTTA